ncbi:MAG: germination protein YpeB [Clostridia bacterium]|nr:germination protein YpeB [Clostridia bacterium]
MLKKRTLIRIVCFCIAIPLALVGLVIVNYRSAERFRTQLVNGYSGSLYRVSEGLNNINLMLQKGIYAASATQLSSLSATIMREAGTTKAALAQLPLSGGEYASINKFLSQVGDYSLYLSKKTIAGSEITEAERENWVQLSNTAQTLAGNIENLRLNYEETGVWDAEITENVESELNFAHSMLEIEESLTDYPTLVYDGPFSDHILTSTPKMTEQAEEISREAAREKAAKVLLIEPEQVKDEGDETGVMECYAFSGGDGTVAITKKGGYIVYFRKFRAMGEETLSYEQAVLKAKAYLEKYDVTVAESYYFADEGICTVNFAHKEGSVICYPDLIKVGVALDTGEILSVEARGYIMNHHTRTVATPKHTEKEAQAVLSDNLTVESVQQAIIPLTAADEAHCYEFLCRGIKDEEILVYISTETLQEENILVLLKTDGGTLTK